MPMSTLNEHLDELPEGTALRASATPAAAAPESSAHLEQQGYDVVERARRHHRSGSRRACLPR